MSPLSRPVLVFALALLGMQPVLVHSHEEDLLIVVGEFLSIEELPDPCEGQTVEVNADGTETFCIAFDAYYQARYRVREVLEGPATAGQVLEFRIADHYGFPGFAGYRHALLFVSVPDQGDAFLEKYLGFPVHETATGGWAHCGEPSFVEADLDALEPIRLAAGVDFGGVGDLNAEGVRQRFPSPVYEIRNGTAYCRMGWDAKRLAAAVKTQRQADEAKRQASRETD
jgi:hypothetical protein